MSQLTEATLWIGRTKKRKRFKIYAIGKRPSGATTLWILASGDATIPPLSAYPVQQDGFDTAEEASNFASRAFPTRAHFTRFLSENLNPLSLNRDDAPKLEQQLSLWDED